MTDTLIRLLNPQFGIEFMGKEYMVRKATLEKSSQFQTRVKELSGDPAMDTKMVSYAFYLLLKDSIPDLTEETVSQNIITSEIDPLGILVQLGFINPSKVNQDKEQTGTE